VQILRIIDHLWLNNNLDLKLITYRVFPTDLNVGYIEFINSTSLNVIKNSSGVGGTLDREIIIKHLRCVNSDESSYEINYNDKTDNFIKSLAGYCVATCVLGVANRVTRNLLIKSNGIFFHADFSRILGNFKKTLGIKKERSKFLLTPEMANVYIFEQKEKDFKKFCVKAFNVLRYNASRLINLFIIMSTAGMSSFLGISDIQYIKQMLVLETPNDEDAGNYFIEEIRKCKNERLRQLDFLLQNLKL
jgi:phosphatidylinositol-4,5-bisphosphate 3-kinase